MSKNFHQDYAGSVGRFCRSLPPELGITTQAVDAYFRACALYLWAGSPGGGGGLSAINQIYTDRPAPFTAGQLERALAYYRGNPDYTAGVPEFFQHLAEDDARRGKSRSRAFAALQKELLMLWAAWDGDLSFSESRRITRLHDQLTAACDRAGVPVLTLTPESERRPGGARPSSEKSARELNDIMDEFSRVIARDRSRSLYSDFFGTPPAPSRSPWPPCR